MDDVAEWIAPRLGGVSPDQTGVIACSCYARRRDDLRPLANGDGRDPMGWRCLMKVKTGIKAGGISLNHNEAQGGLKVKTGIKAGGVQLNHNEAQGGLKVKTGIKAGGIQLNHNEALARSA